MSFERKANYVVEQAELLAPRATTWADFQAEIFGHTNGIIPKTFPDEAERQLFYDSEQYAKVSNLRRSLMKKLGTTKGATPEKSGRVLVRLPKTVHKALEVEAAREGVSVNQLAVSKLSVPLREHVDLSHQVIVDAFTKVFDGYSIDRVVVDPDLNAKFLMECRRVGLAASDYQLNHSLMDIRKSKKVPLPKTEKRTEFRDFDQYHFAAEIAVRIVQRSKGVKLDQILCDPALAFEFDEIARQLAPNQSVLKLRWAALNLRKTRRLSPEERKGESEAVNLIPAGAFKLLKPSDLPDTEGVYSIFDQNRPVFASETEDLRQRLILHRQGRMPNWLGVDDDYECIVKYAPMPTSKQKDRDAWLQWFIDHERPLLNYQKVA